MAMTVCRECKASVSSAARVCPSCGISKPVRRVGWRWAIAGLVLGIFAVIAITGDDTKSPSGDTKAAARAECTATMSKFLNLQTNMSYSHAASILGCRGEEVNRAETGGISLVVYQWKGNGILSSMNATFQNDRLVAKAQLGLKD